MARSLRRCRTSRRWRTTGSSLARKQASAATSVGLPHPAQRDALDHVVDVVLRRPVRIGVSITAGRDAVDEDAARRRVLADRLGHRDHGRLARRVGGRHRVSLLARDRGDEHDPPIPALDHAGETARHMKKEPFGVDRKDALPLLVGDVGGAERLAGDPAELTSTSIRPRSVSTCRDRGVHVGRGGDVAGDREVAVDRLAVEDGDLRAACPQPRGRGGPIPLAPPVTSATRPPKS